MPRPFKPVTGVRIPPGAHEKSWFFLVLPGIPTVILAVDKTRHLRHSYSGPKGVLCRASTPGTRVRFSHGAQNCSEGQSYFVDFYSIQKKLFQFSQFILVLQHIARMLPPCHGGDCGFESRQYRKALRFNLGYADLLP